MKAGGMFTTARWNGVDYYRTKFVARFGMSSMSIGSMRLTRAFGGAVFTNAPQERLDPRRPVIVHLDHPLFHVGDQIFFRPLVQRLKEGGFQVSVTTSPNLEFLFKDMPRVELRQQPGALVISRVEALDNAAAVYGPSASYFGFYMASRSIVRPIANFLLEALIDWFRLSHLDRRVRRASFCPFATAPESVLKKFRIPLDQPLVILSNYIDSGHHRKLPWREREIVHRAANFSRGIGGLIVHVGTARDKERDRQDYANVVDVDLRGATTVEDLFHLLAHSRIRAVFCFDTAILHIARIFGAETTLVTRHYLSPREREQKARAFYQFFAEA